MPFQYANEANPRAHYEGTGAEIAEALDRVDVLVAGLGTGGTLMGTGERLRESSPTSSIAAAEPLPGDPVMGLRSLEDGYVPPILDVSKLDRKLLVSNAESVAGLRALLEREGIFAGVSCRGRRPRCAQARGASSTRASSSASSPTRGWKYLSADFWDAADVEARWRRPPGGSPRGGRAGARRARARRRRRTRLRARALPTTASPSATSRARTPPRRPTASSSSAPAGDVVPRGRGLRARRLPLAPDRRRAVAHRRREHRALGGQAVSDPVARTGELRAWRIRAGRVEEIEVE